MSRPFTVGIHVDGVGSHPSARLDAGGDADRPLTGAHAREVVTRIEAAGFSFATFAGSHLPPASAPEIQARLDPVQLAAFGAPITSRLALIPEVPATYVEPFHTATQLASLDYAAHGRAGWLVSAEDSEAAARQYGRDALGDDALAVEVVDVVAAVRRLWDSWEDDAVIADLPTGRYIDRERLHYVDFAGRSFSVKGPAITPRPPQGQPPVLVQLAVAEGPGAGDRGARSVAADGVVVPAGPVLDESARRARDLGAPFVIADLEVVLDSRGEPAADRLARLDGARPWGAGDAERFVGTTERLVRRIRDLAEQVDGVRIIPASLDRDLDELHHRVLPGLTSAGLLEGPRATARQTFGLPRAENVFENQGRD